VKEYLIFSLPIYIPFLPRAFPQQTARANVTPIPCQTQRLFI